MSERLRLRLHSRFGSPEKGTSIFHGSRAVVEQSTTPLSLPSPSAAMAALPASHEQYQAEMAVLREQITAVRTATSVEQMVQLGMPVQETTAKLAEQFIISIAAIEGRITAMEGNNASDDKHAGGYTGGHSAGDTA